MGRISTARKMSMFEKYQNLLISREELLRDIIQKKLDYRLFYLYKLWQKDDNLKIQLPLDIIWEIHKILIKSERYYYGPENRLPVKLISDIFSDKTIAAAKRNKIVTKDIVIYGIEKGEKYETYVRCGFRSRANEDKFAAYYHDIGLIKIGSRLYVNKVLYNKAKEEIKILERIMN